MKLKTAILAFPNFVQILALPDEQNFKAARPAFKKPVFGNYMQKDSKPEFPTIFEDRELNGREIEQVGLDETKEFDEANSNSSNTFTFWNIFKRPSWPTYPYKKEAKPKNPQWTQMA